MTNRFVLEVVFVSLLLILSKARDVRGPGLSCLTSSPGPAEGQLRVTFLREDTSGARSLYLTVWFQEARLERCEVNTDPLVAERYHTVCHRNDTKDREVIRRLNITSGLLAPDGPCASGSSRKQEFLLRTRDGSGRKARNKRAWIFPGTLWCGSGSTAGKYEELGTFEGADRCCREHDHCLHIIPAFTVNYGVFNPNFYTVSHCKCDRRFRECLLSVNDTISDMVGYSFFNVFQVPCFKLKQRNRCIKKHWCKEPSKAPYAVFKTSPPYNTFGVTHQYADTDSIKVPGRERQPVTESPMIDPHRRSSQPEHRCGVRNPPTEDTFFRKSTKEKGCKNNQKANGVAPSQMPQISRVSTTTQSAPVTLLKLSNNSTVISNEKRAAKGKHVRGGHKNSKLDQQMSSAVPPTTSYLTQAPKLQLYPTTSITSVTKTRKSRKGAPSPITLQRVPLRSDAVQPRCKSCQEDEKAIRNKTITQANVTTNELPFKMTTTDNLTLKKVTGAGKQDTSMTALKTTDNQHLCGSLKHLDDCKFKIPPLEKKYGLQNMEAKTIYHCDCTSRLAVEIESFRQPSILPSLMVDFVSQRCFTLPTDKKCHGEKSCSSGFTKASDLHQALKKIEEKDIAGVRISSSDRKRGIPVRLYKRCLRLERRAEIVARLR
ncbi:uncharacterized protein KZ484_003972 isoform 2-T2 [Pholidichthys leucotaenia]